MASGTGPVPDSFEFHLKSTDQADPDTRSLMRAISLTELSTESLRSCLSRASHELPTILDHEFMGVLTVKADERGRITHFEIPNSEGQPDDFLQAVESCSVRNILAGRSRIRNIFRRKLATGGELAIPVTVRIANKQHRDYANTGRNIDNSEIDEPDKTPEPEDFCDQECADKIETKIEAWGANREPPTLRPLSPEQAEEGQ